MIDQAQLSDNWAFNFDDVVKQKCPYWHLFFYNLYLICTYCYAKILLNDVNIRIGGLKNAKETRK